MDWQNNIKVDQSNDGYHLNVPTTRSEFAAVVKSKDEGPLVLGTGKQRCVIDFITQTPANAGTSGDYKL